MEDLLQQINNLSNQLTDCYNERSILQTKIDQLQSERSVLTSKAMETFWNIIQEGDQFTCGNQVFEISSIYRNRDPACLYVYELVDGKRENGQTIYKWWLNPVSGLLIQTGWKHVPKQTTNDIKGNSG